MNANKIVRSFTAGVISLCLSGWSLVSSAAAATIVVTTNQDTVDPPFNASSFCGSGGTVANLPGADGKVSLREAVIAANNTPGVKTITFAPSLSGSIIVLSGPLYLCGGNTTLNGDVNGDNTPDITVDGKAVIYPFDVIGIVSSHNTVKNLQVLALPNVNVSGISITTTLTVATAVIDNTIAHNTASIFVGTGFDEFSNSQINAVTIKHAVVRDNTVVGDPVLATTVGDHNVITDLIIAGNTVSGVTGLPGIVATGGTFGPNGETTNSRMDVTIKDNIVTGNSFPGVVGGIAVLGGESSSSNIQVTAQILNNTVTDNTGDGIRAFASVFGGAGNSLKLQIRGNSVENNTGAGIKVFGGLLGVGGQLDVAIKDNTITGNSNPGDTAGIAVLGGFASSDNHVTASLLNNTITGNDGNGIAALAAQDNSSNNDVEVTIRGNTLENNAGLGIATFGGIGALVFPTGDSSGNSLDARIEHNTVKNAFLFGIWVFGGLGSLDGAPNKVANGNEVHAVVTDNTITGTFGEGMSLEAGSSGAANDNEVEVSVRKNTVCGSTEADIHAIGGQLGNPFLPDNTGTGNILEGEIAKNTASTVVVENGVAGNVATVTQFHNAPCP